MGDTAVMLYGSHARGDTDTLSDLDVLLVAEDPPSLQRPNSSYTLDGVSVSSSYSWSEIAIMRETGSLFLVHLGQEGRLIASTGRGEARLSAHLRNLPRYKNAGTDVASFATSLEDVRAALDGDNPAVRFEMAALATLVRHASILGCYLLGQAHFGRYSAVSHFVTVAGLPAEIPVHFPSLYQFRLAQDGRHPLPALPDQEFIRQWVGWAWQVVRRLEDEVDV